ncbi:hypothetical protein FD00_GL002347 [Liquorilactobacillus mali KCTC 3596 = DSM 20444]|uniref:Uncharacterized protein n=1 Tax=Liquorilactobacillus mali KCTC 3596 = DSM 20444 TaxID=1046596 RepID=A0A0R2E4T3_9LACO|nr:hypothetical protein FD00_GL002347 [Liquorilactobacillus mali KCTC 3596 = DSM 20444]
MINNILIKPIVSVEFKPKICHCPVLSVPLIVVDSIIQILETVETVRIIQDAIHIKPPINAHFRPKDFSNHVKTPPGSSRIATPNSENISVEGTKKKRAARMYHIIPASPMV